MEAGVARRGLALACYQAGDFQEARIHCEQALEACELDYDREAQERFHDATGPIVMSVLAVTLWQLGEAERARELIEQAIRRAIELDHAPSMAHPYFWKSHLEILRRRRRLSFGRGGGARGSWPGTRDAVLAGPRANDCRMGARSPS